MFSIGKSAFVNCTALTEVKFEEGSRLDTINDCAFWGTGLTSIVLPSSLTTLSTGTSTNETVSVFRDCTKLISVTLSANMTSLNRLSFFGCTSLREILVDKGSTAFKSIGGVLFSADGKELVYYPTANTSTEYKVPEGVEKIGDYSFFHYYKSTIVDYADKLIKIILPESVKEIGAYAFRYCANLENIEFAADGQLETIGDYAFANITALKSISVPDSVKTIGNNTFQNDKNLKEVVFDADGLLTEIGNSAFQSTGIESLELPKGVTTIGTSAFSSCASLTNVKLSENLTEISATLFSKCSLLSSITIPKGVTIIGKNAFQSCTKLEAIVIPKGVTEIADYAFNGCSGLESISFANDFKLTKIGSRAFTGCTLLSEVSIPDGVEAISEGMFYGATSLQKVVIPNSVTAIGNNAINSERDFRKTQQKISNNIENSLQMIA